MTDEHICPYCGRATHELNVNADESLEPEHPIFYLTRWAKDAFTKHSAALRFSREVEGKGRFSTSTEYRYGLVADRICLDCPGHYTDLRVDMAMPHSICELRRKP